MNKKIFIAWIIFLFIFTSMSPIIFGSFVRISDKRESKLPSFGDGGLMDSTWPMYCHDIRHTGKSPYNTIDTWNEVWRFKQHVNDYVRGSPVIGNDSTIYFGGTDFYALYPNGTMKWKYDNIGGYIWSCPTLDEYGMIYIGSVYDFSNGNHLYAINPNGTLKWKYFTGVDIFSSPVIGEDNIIYFGSGGGSPPAGSINALYPNGTLKWKYNVNHVVYSSPALSDDGTIYCGSHDTYLYALYPNGTLKWKYKTDDWIRISPCIADDGTVYIVSLDGYLYAINPDGSFKWKTNVGAGTSPTIGQDGIVYCGYSNLHAVNPVNGSIVWSYNVDGAIKGSTPCNSVDGTIFFGTDAGWFYAVNSDGTLKWREKIANEFIDSAPAIGEDGTVYVGSACKEEIGGSIYNIGYLHAFGIGSLEVDANGPYYGLINEPVHFTGSSSGGYSPHSYHWDFGDTYTSVEQNPIHTYVTSSNYTVILTVTDNTSNTSTDTTWAWIQENNTQPNKPTINGPINGNAGTSYPYTVSTSDPDNNIIWYNIDWGDNTNTGWIGPYDSGTEITRSHSWNKKGMYIIKVKAKDPYNSESSEATLEVTIPRSRFTDNSLFFRFLERFPLLQKLLNFSL
jgi:outer membrane protein assembly factor BamB